MGEVIYDRYREHTRDIEHDAVEILEGKAEVHYQVDQNRSYTFCTSVAAAAGTATSDIRPTVPVATAATTSFHSHKSSSMPAKTRMTDECSMMGNNDIIINIFRLK